MDLIGDGGGESFRRFLLKEDSSEQIAESRKRGELRAAKGWWALVGCLGRSIPVQHAGHKMRAARPDAPKYGAEEKIGPLRSR